MDGCASKSLSLSPLQRRILEETVARRECAQGLASRARIILLAADGLGVLPTARQLHVDVKTVRLWRTRWVTASAGWEQDGEDWDEKVWREKIQQTLRDAHRSGAPCTFQAEHVCQIIALACKKPGDLALPISHWSAADLRREVLKQKIVPTISARQVGRFLKRRTSGRTACAIT
jgi:putative transposase